jgi:hypothetical protein
MKCLIMERRKYFVFLSIYMAIEVRVNYGTLTTSVSQSSVEV